ncbi:four-carbon acid sugar kinase family protein, partial [Acinetobacter baumannii]
DRLISESPKRFDPLTPMTDPDLQRVLRPQTPHPVGLLARPVIVQGRAAMRAHLARLAESGVRHVITDATDEADLIA